MIRVFIGDALVKQFPWNGKSCTLAQALSDNEVGLDLPCGGHGRCGKCKVKAAGDVSPMDALEQEKLAPDDLQDGMRLACKALICGENVQITIPVSGILRIETGTALRKMNWSPWATGLGISVDIGTTTVVAYLWDLDDRRLLEIGARKNPQGCFGADTISRLEASLNGEGYALQMCIRRCLADLTAELCGKAERLPQEITGAVITGNTAMLYLLCCYEVRDLAFAPFDAVHRFGITMTAADLGLPWGENCRVYLPPCISAYVGADISCGLLACDVLSHTGSALLTDVGTNGEIVLLHKGRLFCCATAAGPAFEGVGISCGSSAIPGAVDKVELRGDSLRIHTIDEKLAQSICGSGLMDAVSCLVRRGDIEDSGYMEAEMVPLSGGVCLTRSDVRAFQLAKSAICAGIETLLFTADVLPEALDAMWLAGGFGSKLSVDSAAKIGLFPAALLRIAIPAGNTAAAGAAMLLCNGNALTDIRKIAEAAETVDLSNSPVFQEKFMKNMILGEVL